MDGPIDWYDGMNQAHPDKPHADEVGEPKACPFCGTIPHNPVLDMLECQNANCWFKVLMRARLWNTRPIEDTLRTQLEAANDELRHLYNADREVMRLMEEISALRTQLEAANTREAALREELSLMEKRASKAELRTLSLYTPLWEHGYDCNDYEAQEIVGTALRERDTLRTAQRELLEKAWAQGHRACRAGYSESAMRDIPFLRRDLAALTHSAAWEDGES